MKKYISMMVFVVLMGAISVGILIGADLITKDRIAQNAELTWKSAILTHHKVEHTDANFSTMFDETFTVNSATEPQSGQEINTYVNTTSNEVSFRFNGNGLWDVIQGVITLQSDFRTIVAITVTKQGETPGLGGIVAEKQYLDKFIGKYFDEVSGLLIVKTASEQNEVDAIVGATGTSNAFAGILNTNQRLFNELFGSGDAFAPVKKTVLTHSGITYTDENYEKLFEDSFELETKSGLTIYKHQNGYVSYTFETDGFKGPIKAVITLKADFQTIHKITVLSQSEAMGATIQTDPEVLGNFENKKFSTTVIVKAEPVAANEVLDGFGGATTTKTKFVEGLNTTYATYYQTFKEGK